MKLFNHGVVLGSARVACTTQSVSSEEQSSSLLGFLGVSDDKTVHIHDSLLGQTLAHGDGSSIRRLKSGGSNKTSLLELGKAVALDSSCGQADSLSLGSTVLLSSEMLTEALDSDVLSHVELVTNSGGTNVKPVRGVWRELFKASSLSVLGPLR